MVPDREAPDTEPLRLALGTMTGLDAGERAVIQILARPATSAARFRLLRAARKLRRTAPALPFWAAAQGGATARTARAPLDPTVEPDVRAILQKAASPLWRCGVRVAVSSVHRPRARGKIHALAGAFAVFEGRNGFRRRRALGGLQRLEGRVLRRGYLLSVPELAQVAALPAEPVPGSSAPAPAPSPHRAPCPTWAGCWEGPTTRPPVPSRSPSRTPGIGRAWTPGRGGAFTFRTQPLPDPEDPERVGAVRARSATRFGRPRSTVEGEIRNCQRVAGTRLLPRRPDQNGAANR